MQLIRTLSAGTLLALATFSMAQADQCSDLQLCIDTSTAACNAAAGNPVCVQPLVSLTELRAAITAQCGCGVVVTEGLPDACVCPGNASENKADHIKNFGKFRSCIAKATNALRENGLIDALTKSSIKADNTLCKAVIKAQMQADKSNNGNKP